MKPTVKPTGRLALVLSTALGVLLSLQPMPAQAYEEDTHFTLTYVLCRAVGFTDAEAMTVASYDQGMDDSALTVANGGPGGVIPNIAEESLWHAIPVDGQARTVLQRKEQLWAQVLREPDPASQLKRLGVFFHYQQDTWAHRQHANSDSTSFQPYQVPVGHALHGHQPDRPPFDPVCALRCLEDGIGYARTFLNTVLRRTPNALFDNYQPAKGEVDGNWSDGRKGQFFNQLASDSSTPARGVLTDLIRSQIDAYTSSIDANPNFLGRATADEVPYDRVRDRFQKACDRAQLRISVPSSRTKITTLTTSQLGEGNLGTRDYAVKIYTGDKLGAGTDSNIFLAITGKTGVIGEQRLNGLIAGNAFEQNQTNTCVLSGLKSVGEITSITIRSDDLYPASAWYLGWVKISSAGLTTRTFTLNDWIESGKLTRTLGLPPSTPAPVDPNTPITRAQFESNLAQGGYSYEIKEFTRQERLAVGAWNGQDHKVLRWARTGQNDQRFLFLAEPGGKKVRLRTLREDVHERIFVGIAPGGGAITWPRSDDNNSQVFQVEWQPDGQTFALREGTKGEFLDVSSGGDAVRWSGMDGKNDRPKPNQVFQLLNPRVEKGR